MYAPVPVDGGIGSRSVLTLPKWGLKPYFGKVRTGSATNSTVDGYRCAATHTGRHLRMWVLVRQPALAQSLSSSPSSQFSQFF